MSLILSLILLAILVTLYLLFRRSSQAALRSVPEHLRSGALLIDVRSPNEFNSGHLPNAINLPLNELDSLLYRYAQNRDQVLLLHCRSGMLSSLAARRLKRQGYIHIFNLGSYSRAARLIRGGGSTSPLPSTSSEADYT